MLSKFKYYKYYLFLFLFILIGCQLQDPNKNHGILFLENRSDKLKINQSNKNDVISILGQPHTKSAENNEDIWIYIERQISKGKIYKLGKHNLVVNNVLVLDFNKYSILKNKKFLTKDQLKEIEFSSKETNNILTKKSFIADILSSVKQKMYGNR